MCTIIITKSSFAFQIHFEDRINKRLCFCDYWADYRSELVPDVLLHYVHFKNSKRVQFKNISTTQNIFLHILITFYYICNANRMLQSTHLNQRVVCRIKTCTWRSTLSTLKCIAVVFFSLKNMNIWIFGAHHRLMEASPIPQFSRGPGISSLDHSRAREQLLYFTKCTKLSG